MTANDFTPEVAGPGSEIASLDAGQMTRQLRAGALSACEVMNGLYDQIEAVNPRVNALCTVLPREEAVVLADEADHRRAQGQNLGPLHGLPIACKDLANTRGIRTTFGSLPFKDNVPATDSLFVERLRAAGALIIGKTNTPEFGAGSNTFNSIFGVTRNPYDLSKTAGGSSGGAAAALAARLLPLADGSDMGGSLRNPAAFCNVVGFRPSMGRVPSWPSALTWQSRLGVEGPMARNVDDVGLLLSVMAGPDPRDPLSISESAAQFANIPERDFSNVRIAWTADLGFLTVARTVKDVFSRSLSAFEELACRLDEKCPDLSDAMEVFRVLRGSNYAVAGGQLLAEHRSEIKATLAQNIEYGLALKAADLHTADQQRAALYHGVNAFFEQYDFLVLPTTQVAPFPHEKEWVTDIDGTAMSDYLEWMSICCVITVLDLPAISVPCGFTDDGLPLGLQIVGKPRADLEVLQLARAFETLRPHAKTPPAL